MTNLEWLENIKRFNDKEKEPILWQSYRQTRALEIIAEELCKMNKRTDNLYNHNTYAEQSHDHTG